MDGLNSSQSRINIQTNGVVEKETIKSFLMYDDLPSFFSQKYHPFCGSLPDIFAVIVGVKPVAELSLSPDKEEAYQSFVKFIRRFDVYSVKYRYKAEHKGGANSKEKKKNLIRRKNNELPIRVYLSKSKKILDAYRFGDPEIGLGDISRPSKNKIAALHIFASDLGYPDCCIKSYLENGQLKKISSYSRLPEGNRASFYYNNFLHSISNYYLSFHSPCSFNCQKTKIYNRKIFEAIKKYEPKFSERLQRVLTMPMVTWYNKSNFPLDDRIIVLFDGHISGNTIMYSRCYILKTNYPNNKIFSNNVPEDLIYLRAGNKVINTKQKIYVYKEEKLMHTIKKQSKFHGLLFNFHA